jgi:hypothetical protein
MFSLAGVLEAILGAVGDREQEYDMQDRRK